MKRGLSSIKQEPLFDLIKNMTKAEKRNFKLYATRMQGNQDAKFMQLFNIMDSMDEYDETRILARCPIRKIQLANLKAHLYRQVLVSLRLLDSQRVVEMSIREQLDFATILYERGLPRQAAKILDKVGVIALRTELNSAAIDILELRKKLEMLSMTHNRTSEAESIGHQIRMLSKTIDTTNRMAHISLQLYGLYLKLGHARSDKDLLLIKRTFGPQIKDCDFDSMSFTGKINYFEANVWYHYIQHNFVQSYRYACYWIELYKAYPEMQVLHYDNYINGYARMLDGLFLMRTYKRFKATLEEFERQEQTLTSICAVSELLYRQIEYLNRMNLHLFKGSFNEGVKLIPEIKQFIIENHSKISVHDEMLLQYKIASIYFGNQEYQACINSLSPIITTRDPQVRRDLQCFARMLNLLCCYEAGIDYNFDYQIRSLYSFLVKMNDMGVIQQEMIAFVKKLGRMPASSLKSELTILYNKLLPYSKSTTYSSRTLYYLDVISWLESKITGKSMAEIITRQFRETQDL